MLLFLIIYVVGFVLTYGMFFAYWQRRWPNQARRDYVSDIADSFMISVFWFMTLVILLVDNLGDKKFYGFKWK